LQQLARLQQQEADEAQVEKLGSGGKKDGQAPQKKKEAKKTK